MCVVSSYTSLIGKNYTQAGHLFIYYLHLRDIFLIKVPYLTTIGYNFFFYQKITTRFIASNSINLVCSSQLRSIFLDKEGHDIKQRQKTRLE